MPPRWVYRVGYMYSGKPPQLPFIVRIIRHAVTTALCMCVLVLVAYDCGDDRLWLLHVLLHLASVLANIEGCTEAIERKTKELAKLKPKMPKGNQNTRGR